MFQRRDAREVATNGSELRIALPLTTIPLMVINGNLLAKATRQELWLAGLKQIPPENRPKTLQDFASLPGVLEAVWRPEKLFLAWVMPSD
jgi:hypothetical protein